MGPYREFRLSRRSLFIVGVLVLLGIATASFPTRPTFAQGTLERPTGETSRDVAFQLLSDPRDTDPAAPSALVALNAVHFRPGQQLTIGVKVDNPQGGAPAELLLGALLPNGSLVLLSTVGTPTFSGPVGNLSALPTQAVPPDFHFNNPGFIQLTLPSAGLPAGTYQIFAAVLRQGALANGQLDPGDVLAADSKTFDFSVAPGEQVFYVTASTQKICQLTGQRDQNSQPRFGIIGADLGFPVEHANAGEATSTLYLLFGDTAGSKVTAVDPAVEFNPFGVTVTPNPTLNLDSIGFSEATVPSELCTTLQFIADSSGVYAPPQVDLATYPTGVRHMRHGTFGVPASGFSWGDRFYVFFAHLNHVLPAEPPRRSILASSANPKNVSPDRNTLFRYEFEVSTDKFINIAPVLISKVDFAPGELPADGAAQALLLFGSGEYRKSHPFLAYVPLAAAAVPDTSHWFYFSGLDPAGRPIWLPGESNATSLFTGVANFEPCHLPLPEFPSGSGPCIGEMSVTWNRFLGKWLMLYNGLGQARGIRFHVADKPWGSWSDVRVGSPPVTSQDVTIAPSVLFDPSPAVDKGYRSFMHLVLPAYGTVPAKSCSTNVFDPKKPPTAAPECDDLNSSTLDICVRARDSSLSCQHSFDSLYDNSFLDFDGSGNLESAGARIGEVGGEYGPYVISRFTTGGSGSTTIYFVMSTWNPYQAVLMTSTLRLGLAQPAPPAQELGLANRKPEEPDDGEQEEAASVSGERHESLERAWPAPQAGEAVRQHGAGERAASRHAVSMLPSNHGR